MGWGQTQGWTEGDQLVNVEEWGGGSMQDVDCRLTDQTVQSLPFPSCFPPHPYTPSPDSEYWRRSTIVYHVVKR